MSDPMGVSPDTVLNPVDPGDDTQHRFRYQAVRVCCYLMSLFDQDEGVEEVFCEHHEDILIKYTTGRFRGVQVKTRADGSVPFKAVDDEVRHSIRRFIQAEKDFPEHFDGFILAANCGFWDERKNGSNLNHLIELAKGSDLTSAPPALCGFLTRLCDKPKVPKTAKRKGVSKPTLAPPMPTLPPVEDHKAQLERALAVLQKLRLEQTPPLAQADQPLLHALAKCPAVGNTHRYCDLKAIATALIAEVLKASTREHDSAKQTYFAICRNPGGVEAEAVITLKRFDRTRTEAAIQLGLSPARTLTTPFVVDRLPSGTRIQAAKMTAGGLVIDDVDEAVQQRHAAEYALTTWIVREGVPAANGRYQDVRSAVLTECNEARSQASQPDGSYGPAMLKLVKDRIKSLHTADRAYLHGLRYDQLLGVAGILTEDCLLWWGERFDLPTEAVP